MSNKEQERYYAVPFQHSTMCAIWREKEGTTGVKYFECPVSDAEELLERLNAQQSPASDELIEMAYEEASEKIRDRYKDPDDLRIVLAALALFNTALRSNKEKAS